MDATLGTASLSTTSSVSDAVSGREAEEDDEHTWLHATQSASFDVTFGAVAKTVDSKEFIECALPHLEADKVLQIAGGRHHSLMLTGENNAKYGPHPHDLSLKNLADS